MARVNENVRKGQIVLIEDENQKINHWSLGRIVETHPRGDGLIRVVTLKIQSEIFKRPIAKISLLPGQHLLEK